MSSSEICGATKDLANYLSFSRHPGLEPLYNRILNLIPGFHWIYPNLKILLFITLILGWTKALLNIYLLGVNIYAIKY